MPALINTKKIQNADATPADENRQVLDLLIDGVTGNLYSFTLTAAQALALNATPIEVLPAPGADKAYIVERVEVYKAAGTAYAGIATGEDLALRYTNGSGTILAQVETTGFRRQAHCHHTPLQAIHWRLARPPLPHRFPFVLRSMASQEQPPLSTSR